MWQVPISFWSTQDVIIPQHLNTLEENSRVNKEELDSHDASVLEHWKAKSMVIAYAGPTKYPSRITETEAGNTIVYDISWATNSVTITVTGADGSYTITSSVSGTKITNSINKPISGTTLVNPTKPAWSATKTNWVDATTIGVADLQRIENNQNYEDTVLPLHQKNYFAHNPSRQLNLSYAANGFVSQITATGTARGYKVVPAYSNGRITKITKTLGTKVLTDTFTYDGVGRITRIDRQVTG